MLLATDAFAAGCGSRGGPGFRGPNGKCVGWKPLNKVCGEPPSTFCSYEGAGIGDTALEKGSKFLAAGAAGLAATGGAKSARAFNQRTIKQDGVACATTQRLTQFRACSPDACAAQFKEPKAAAVCTTKCASDVETAVKAGECARVVKGTDTTIEAGSHSFDWVRVRLPDVRKELWVERSLVLD